MLKDIYPIPETYYTGEDNTIRANTKTSSYNINICEILVLGLTILKFFHNQL